MYARRIITNVQVTVLSLALAVGTVYGQSLTDAVTTTLRTNPDILASKYNLEAAQQLRKQARSGYFPVLDFVVAGGRETSNNSTTRAAGLPDLELDRRERSLKLTQLLYDGFATSSLVKQQTHLVDAAILRLSSSQENVSLRAVQVYLEVLRRDAVVGLTEENLTHHEDTLSKI